MIRVVESSLGRLSRLVYARFALFPCSSGVPVLCAQQRSSHHEQISQGAGHEQTVGVLGDAAVAHLGEAEDALDHQKRVLDFGAHLRFVSILGPLHRAQRLMAARRGLCEVARVGCNTSDHLGLSDVGTVAPYAPLSSVQQMPQCPAVVHVSRRSHHGVDQLGLGSPPRCALSCQSTTGCPSWFVSSRGHAHPIDSWSRTER